MFATTKGKYPNTPLVLSYFAFFLSLSLSLRAKQPAEHVNFNHNLTFPNSAYFSNQNPSPSPASSLTPTSIQTATPISASSSASSLPVKPSAGYKKSKAPSKVRATLDFLQTCIYFYQVTFMKARANDIARQLTLIERDLFCAVSSSLRSL